jgi:plastocyanin
MGMQRRRLLALVAAGATLGGVGAVTAQAATPAKSATSSGTTLKLSANKSALKFNVTKLTAKPGNVTLVMSNPSSISHDIALKGNGLKPVVGKIVGKGKTSTITATVKKGSYEFYCSVPGHEAAGMKGTLTVT